MGKKRKYKLDEDDIAFAVVSHVLARLENPNDPFGRLVTAWFEKALRFLLGLLGVQAEPREDPVTLLRQAQQETGQAQAVNRARGDEVRAQRDELQGLVAQTRRTVDDLQARAEEALRSGNRPLAQDLLTEKQHYLANLTRMQDLLQTTTESMQAVEAALRREEERIRVKAAEALAMKAQWNQSQIELSLNKALNNKVLNSASARSAERSFEGTQAQVSQAQSESAAWREMAEEDPDRRLARSAAAAELSALEQRLGVPTAQTGRPFSSPTALDRQLQELEARIGRQQ